MASWEPNRSRTSRSNLAVVFHCLFLLAFTFTLIIIAMAVGAQS